MAWTATHDAFFKKIDQEMDAYARSMWDRPGSEVYDRADEISATRFCYNQLAGSLDSYPEDELEALLRYDDPLKVVCQQWMSKQDFVLSGEFERVLRDSECLACPDEMITDMDAPAMG